MVGAAVAVFARRTTELRHRDQDCVFSQTTQVNPEGRYRLRELAQHISQLSIHGTLIYVMVPAADVGEGDLHPDIRLDKLRSLPQRVAKASLRIIGAGGRRVFLRIGGL